MQSEIGRILFQIRTITLLAATLIVSTTRPAVADTPAQLVVGEDSIEERLRIPKRLPPGRYAVHCEVVVNIGGFLDSLNCYSIDRRTPRTLVGSVQRAVRYSRVVPATRNGQPTKVFAVLMVLVDTTLSKPLVLAVPNNGVEYERYGLLYTAPQRFTQFSWESGSHGHSRWPVLVWQQLSIDERGKVVEYTLQNASGAAAATVRAIESSVRSMEFMPGFFQGKPVPMRYKEPAYSGF